MTTDPLPTNDPRAVPPSTSGVHSVKFSGDEIFMMGWDGEAPQPISLYIDSYFMDTPLASRSLGHSDLSQMRFLDRLQFHTYTCSMFRL